MKTFPTTAGRLRSIASVMRAVGWGFCGLSALWLLWVALSLPKSATPTAVVTAAQVTTQPGHPEAVALFSSRSLQPEARPPIAVTAPPAPPPRAPDVEIIATLVNPGQIPSAFARSRKAKKLVTLQPGNQIDGATVKSITAQEVVLELQGQSFPIPVGRKGS